MLIVNLASAGLDAGLITSNAVDVSTIPGCRSAQPIGALASRHQQPGVPTSAAWRPDVAHVPVAVLGMLGTPTVLRDEVLLGFRTRAVAARRVPGLVWQHY